MATEKKCLYLHEMTGGVRRRCLNVNAAIIPVGNHSEQHGPHATFQMDPSCSREFARLLGSRSLYPNVLVAAAVPIGISAITCTSQGPSPCMAETLINVLMDMVKIACVITGIKRFFL